MDKLTGGFIVLALIEIVALVLFFLTRILSLPIRLIVVFLLAGGQIAFWIWIYDFLKTKRI